MSDPTTPLDLDRSTTMPALFRAVTPPQWEDFVRRRPRAISEQAASVALRQAHVERLRELAAIGRRAYGPNGPRADHWNDAPPFVDGVQTAGFDCENLALWVRHVMTEEFAEWPLGAGRPAICTLPDGRAHCVLVIVEGTGLGDYILGAQAEEDLVPWRSLAGYRWHSMLHRFDEWRLIAA
ncbi:transglutaminase-like cysteine peptidase [Pelagibius sp. CAU 1746]|uniref:transglutaminase-like cysteine peptidase n=1 Tax=Pelagibius sp. CAU 1746 TaxID=3140370 RepID=UPI00325BCCEB